ncbi:recombinase family protein [Brevundimonas vitis]|uniref:Recombinase family protein n=1 Tax=Brevundimonas vitisensis TaxID=2800818 RepID=A0ABX7BQ07_9CAUL|nr:recombinase family protein [Brevundimonas vitisensis]QQQ19337.1 recombinase family protein [Brevundimonas vitisensis]
MTAAVPADARYAIYVRQQAVKSLQGQIILCRTYGDQQGWAEAGAYQDYQRSGSVVIGRSGLFEMLGAAARREFSILVISDLSQLGCSAADLPGFLMELKYDGVSVHTPAGAAPAESALRRAC